MCVSRSSIRLSTSPVRCMSRWVRSIRQENSRVSGSSSIVQGVNAPPKRVSSTRGANRACRTLGRRHRGVKQVGLQQSSQSSPRRSPSCGRSRSLRARWSCWLVAGLVGAEPFCLLSAFIGCGLVFAGVSWFLRHGEVACGDAMERAGSSRPTRLAIPIPFQTPRPCGGIGRRGGFKIHFLHRSEGSSPSGAIRQHLPSVANNTSPCWASENAGKQGLVFFRDRLLINRPWSFDEAGSG